MIESYHALDDYKITASKINALLQCPARHKFQFIDKIKAETRSSVLRGISFHKAESDNYEQKIESREDMPIGDVLDIFGSQFDAGMTETLWFPDEDAGKIKDSGYGMLEVYHKQIAPIVQPVSVELPFELTLKGTEQVFAGRIDIVTDDETIIDTKTKKARPSFVDESHKLQLTAYTAGLQVINQRKPKGARIDYVVEKKFPECISYNVDIQNTDIELLLNLIGRYQEIVKTGIDIPNRSHFMCSVRYCQYSQICVEKYGGIVK